MVLILMRKDASFCSADISKVVGWLNFKLRVSMKCQGIYNFHNPYAAGIWENYGWKARGASRCVVVLFLFPK